MERLFMRVLPLAVIVSTLSFSTVAAQDQPAKDLDQRVRKFLESRLGTWRDMNVPEIDGKLLYDLVVKNNYTKGLEIGTSTGHSTVWIAWAMSKTGGKLTTIEIDRGRYEQALKNFEEAGLSGYIDARLADAHELVPKLEGPFDFVFSDADKDWYKNYFIAISPRLSVKGCFTAHNVRTRMGGIREFLAYVRSRPNYETTIDESSGTGMSISYKNFPD